MLARPQQKAIFAKVSGGTKAPFESSNMTPEQIAQSKADEQTRRQTASYNQNKLEEARRNQSDAKIASLLPPGWKEMRNRRMMAEQYKAADPRGNMGTYAPLFLPPQIESIARQEAASRGKKWIPGYGMSDK